MTCLATVLLAVLGLQDAARLVEQLGARSIEAREEAAKKLTELGEKALPQLDRAARDKDAEVAGRAERVIQVIAIGRLLGPRLCKAMPGIESRLAQGPAKAWVDALREANKIDPLERHDLEFLTLMAVHEASDEVAENLVEQATGSHLVVTLSSVGRFLRSDDVTTKALLSLGRLDRRDPTAEFVALLRHPLAEVRQPAALILEAVRGPGSMPLFLEMAKDPDARFRLIATRSLGACPPREAIPTVRALIKDPSFIVRTAAIESAAALGAKEAIPEIRPFLGDAGAGARRAAALALGALGARESIPALIEALSDESYTVREGVLWALGELDAKEAIPRIAALADDPTNLRREWAKAVLEKLKKGP